MPVRVPAKKDFLKISTILVKIAEGHVHQIFVEFLQGVQTNILAIFGYLDLLKFQS